MMQRCLSAELRRDRFIFQDIDVPRFPIEIHCIYHEQFLSPVDKREQVKARGPAINYLDIVRNGISFLESVHRMDTDALIHH